MLELVSKKILDSESLLEDELSQKRFQLAQLLRSTEEMLSAAQHGDWDNVEAIDKSRRRDIVTCFSKEEAQGAPLIKEALSTLIFLNKQITVLVSQAKDDLQSKKKLMNVNKSAVGSYQLYSGQ